MKKIVFTGPESTGKSTVANTIALQSGLPLVNEYARTYLSKQGGKYTYDDLLHIAKGQVMWEQEARSDNANIICDTDLLTIFIWSDVKFGKCDPMIKSKLMDDPATHYFLCTPDIPWKFDPLREDPTNRDELFDIYRLTIEILKVDYTILKGSKDKRLITVQQKLEEIL